MTTELNQEKKDRLKNYLLIYRFKNEKTNTEFVDLIKEHYKGYYEFEEFEDESNFDIYIPLEREDMLVALKYSISQMKSEIGKSDYFYMIHTFTENFDETDDERDILIGYEVVKENDKIWSDIADLHKRGLLNFETFE